MDTKDLEKCISECIDQGYSEEESKQKCSEEESKDDFDFGSDL